MNDKIKKKGGARLQESEKKPRTRKEKIRLAIILALVVLLAVVVTAFAIYRSWAKPPELPDSPKPPSVSDSGSNAPLVSDSALGEDVPSDRKEDFYTFLIVGRDTGGGGNTDTILLASYDVANQQMNIMSIPRDTMVNIPYDIKRINGVYNYSGGGDDGIAALYSEVSQLVGFVPDFEVVIEWKAVGELVEAIDGVWFDVPRNMNYDDPYQYLHIHIEKGYQLLNGEQAMGVIRWRINNDGTGYVTGDIGRIETQQAFLKAVIKQCLQIKNAAKIREFAKVFSDNVQTDLSLGNLVWFAEQAIFGGLTMEKINFITLPGDYNGEAWSRVYSMYQSYVLPDGEALLEVVNKNFNPYLEDRRLEQLDIMSVNADGSLSSTTGIVEDSKAAVPPVIPTPEPEPSEPSSEVTEEPEEPGVNAKPEPTEAPEASAEPGETAQLPEPSPPEERGDPQPETTESPEEGSEDKQGNELLDYLIKMGLI